MEEAMKDEINALERNKTWKKIIELPPNKKATGCKWIYKFYLEEAKGRVDYQGYVFPPRRGVMDFQILIWYRPHIWKKSSRGIWCSSHPLSYSIRMRPLTFNLYGIEEEEVLVIFTISSLKS
ncbi:UNVERIFIED_CONTAM: hypothetical protein Sindi_2224900 [Sesamum indicum]